MANEPDTSWNEAVIVVLPAAYAVNTPAGETVATDGAVDVHFATFVTSFCVPSVYSTFAVNWLALPTVSVAGPAMTTLTVVTDVVPATGNCTVNVVTGMAIDVVVAT